MSSCSNDYGYQIASRHLYECRQCKKQTSVTAGTLFHGSRITLILWFWAINFLGSDKGSISALRLNKLIEVNWQTVRLILKKLRKAMGHRNSLYQLSDTTEVDDALVDGRKKNVLIACESREKKAGFIAMEVVDSICHFSMNEFVKKHLKAGQKVRSDTLPA